MSKFSNTLNDSFKLFIENPKFVIPKLVIAFFYSLMILATIELSVSAIAEPTMDLLIVSIILLGAAIMVSLVDVFVGLMYPVLVKQVKSNQAIHLRNAAKTVLKNSFKCFPSIITVELGFVAVVFILSLPLVFFIDSLDLYMILSSILYVIILLVVVFLFYSLYPILIFENESIVGSLKRSINISLKNRKEVSKVTLFSFFLSLLSYGIAFSIEFFPGGNYSIWFWVAFIIVRVLTAYVYSYLFVLNPIFYLNYSGSKK